MEKELILMLSTPSKEKIEELKKKLEILQKEKQEFITSLKASEKRLKSSNTALLKLKKKNSKIAKMEDEISKIHILLEDAKESVDKITDAELEEIKNYNSPPKRVLMALEAIFFLLEEKKFKWNVIKKKMIDFNHFRKNILNFDFGKVSKKALKAFYEDYVKKNVMDFDKLKKASKAMKHLGCFLESSFKFMEQEIKIKPYEKEIKKMKKKKDTLVKKKEKIEKEKNEIDSKISKIQEEENSIESQIQKIKFEDFERQRKKNLQKNIGIQIIEEELIPGVEKKEIALQTIFEKLNKLTDTEFLIPKVIKDDKEISCTLFEDDLEKKLQYEKEHKKNLRDVKLQCNIAKIEFKEKMDEIERTKLDVKDGDNQCDLIEDFLKNKNLEFENEKKKFEENREKFFEEKDKECFDVEIQCWIQDEIWEKKFRDLKNEISEKENLEEEEKEKEEENLKQKSEIETIEIKNILQKKIEIEKFEISVQCQIHEIPHIHYKEKDDKYEKLKNEIKNLKNSLSEFENLKKKILDIKNLKKNQEEDYLKREKVWIIVIEEERVENDKLRNNLIFQKSIINNLEIEHQNKINIYQDQIFEFEEEIKNLKNQKNKVNNKNLYIIEKEFEEKFLLQEKMLETEFILKIKKEKKKIQMDLRKNWK